MAPTLQTLCQSPKGVKMAQLRQVGVNGFQNTRTGTRFAAGRIERTTWQFHFGPFWQPARETTPNANP